MKRPYIMWALLLLMLTLGTAWAQDESPQTSTPPAPAYGQENTAAPISENPPLSGLDQPGLEPHAAPESFLLVGLHFSESVDSNEGSAFGRSSLGSVTRGLGSVTLQRLWHNYDLALDYIGGVAYYDRRSIGVQQLQQMDLDQRINWKRGQFAVRDSFSYLPEGTFGFGAYGGGGAYGVGLGSMGQGLLGSSAFGGRSVFMANPQWGSLGQTPRLMNLTLADVVEELTPRSSVTVAGGYGFVHFYGSDLSLTGSPLSFIGSSEVSAQVGYNRVLNPKDQLALVYGYQGFDFSSTAGSAFHTHVVQVVYGHRITGRMDLTLGAGPQVTFVQQIGAGTDRRLGVSARASLRYKFPKTYVSLGYDRYDTSGSGLFVGAQSNIVRASIARPISRVWDIFADGGYSHNRRLQLPLPGFGVDANTFQYGFAGFGLHRQLGRNLRAYVSYQFNDLYFDKSFCAAQGLAVCNRGSQRHVGSIGVDWTPRPIRLD